MIAYQTAQTDTDATSHTWGKEFLLSPRFLKDVGRPALCWTLGGTTPSESGRWGPWYHLIEAFGSETIGCENFRGLCTNRENEPQSRKGLNTEKVLGDIVPPPRSLPLPPILSLQLFFWVPVWVPSALPSSSFRGHPCSHWPPSFSQDLCDCLLTGAFGPPTSLQPG